MEHALTGRWKHGEDYIRAKVKEYAKKIQCLKSKVIVFDGFKDGEMHIISVDGVNYTTHEFHIVQIQGLNGLITNITEKE